MKRIFIVIFSTLIFFCNSCTITNHQRIQINIDKALRVKTLSSDICSKIEVILIEPSVFDKRFSGEPTQIEVSANNIFILNQDAKEIGVFDNEGRYLTSIIASDHFIDMSIYLDRYLDVLDGSKIVEYDMMDMSIANAFPIFESSLDLKSFARRDENTFLLAASSGESAYDCEYFINIDNLAVRDHFIKIENMRFRAEDYSSCGFFRDNVSTFFFKKNASELKYCSQDDYDYTIYEWDWGRQITPVSFINVQRTSDKIYMRIIRGEEEYTMIYNTKTGDYSVIQATKDGAYFPIGVIYNDVNYFCVRAHDLQNYLNLESIKVKTTGKQAIPENGNPLVIIKYYL